MAENQSLAGKYKREGSRVEGDRTLLFCTRPPHERTRAKTAEYFMEILPTGKRRYVSSLWATEDPNVYGMEYNRTRYTVSVTDAVVFIDEVTYSR
jgi:hypothetical protein